MQIQKNSRQIPKRKNITSHKNYDDLMYGYLQSISYKDQDNRRWIEAKNITYSKLAKELNITRQTASKRFKNLIELNLVIEYEDKYELPTIVRTDAFLLPQSTLIKLVSALSENCISTYIYLVNRFYANKEQPFIFTITALKDYCGLSTKTKSNNQIITSILEILSKLELISYECETINSSNQIKTQYLLKSVNLTI